MSKFLISGVFSYISASDTLNYKRKKKEKKKTKGIVPGETSPAHSDRSMRVS